MSRNHNKISFIGHLGRDPEMRYTPQGKAVTSFSVAVNGGTAEKQTTTWYSCQAWEKQGEVCNQYLKKGSKVYIEGVLIPDPQTGGPRIWTDNKGEARASFEITVREIEFLSAKPEGAGSNGYAPEPIEDEIPF